MCAVDVMLSRHGRSTRRRVLVLVACVDILGAATAGACFRPVTTAVQPDEGMIEIYANAEWYRARPEGESTRRGVLQERTVPRGPATRPALMFTLVEGKAQHAVYAAQVEEKLKPFVGQTVVLHGKLVDLSDEGFGRELWIAWIRSARPE